MTIKSLFQKIIPSMVLLLSACATPTPVPTSTPTTIPPTSTPVPKSLNAVKIESLALADNLIGQKTEQTLTVYLPPSYNTSTKNYPVIYFLPGFGHGAIFGVSLPADFDKWMSDGTIQEMILVIIPGGSSFYTNSPITGNWEDFVVQEVVGYIDSHYRTIPKAESRGISGHSMGGYGALNIAMLHPDVFSAVYSMSPGLFNENGLWESQMYGDFAIERFMTQQLDVLSQPADKQVRAVAAMPDYFTAAYGMAFAPNPDNSPFYFDYPYTEVNGELIRDDLIWERWESGFGNLDEEIVKYKDNLLALNGIVVDYGIQDQFAWIPQGCIYFDEKLTLAGIPHQTLAYEGNHQNKLNERVPEHMLPFFSDLLVGQ